MHHSQLRWRALWHPEMYHGWGQTRQYFEGWYFKCISADERHAMAFIPGIAMNEHSEQHAFVQVMHGSQNRASYHRFDVQQFRPDTHRFKVKVGNSVFSSDGIDLELPDVQGSLEIVEPTPWPKMLGAPGIMGWFSFVPFMECFHGIVSMNHRLQGHLTIEGESVDFSGGKGYIEKDWGKSFPKAYIWLQTNHFDNANASLIASVAHIPFLGSHFIGFVSGFWLEGRLFRFATYTGARKYVQIHADSVEIIYKNPKTEIRILAHKAAGTELISPMIGAMTGKINESLQARVSVELFENGQRIFEGTGRHAGLEVSLPSDDPEGKILQAGNFKKAL